MLRINPNLLNIQKSRLLSNSDPDTVIIARAMPATNRMHPIQLNHPPCSTELASRDKPSFPVGEADRKHCNEEYQP
jgi:hypothetical protein